MATKLRRLAITEVALVDEGDNPEAAIVIAKRKESPVVEIAKTGNANVGEIPMEFDINAIPEEFRKSVQTQLEKVAADATAAAIAKAKEPEPVAPALEIPADVQKRIDMQQVEIAKLRQELDQRAEAESIAKCKADFGAFPEYESIGKSLYKLDRVDPGLAGDVRKALASAQAIAKKSDKITKQIGTSGEAPKESAGDKLESLAKARVTATGETFFKAYQTVLNENVELYGAYLNESPAPTVVDSGDATE